MLILLAASQIIAAANGGVGGHGRDAGHAREPAAGPNVKLI